MTNITALRPGDHFMFKSFEWVCLDPNHPDGGVLAIMAKPWTKDVKFCPSDKFADERGNWNNYRTSNVRGVLSDMANAVFEKQSLLRHNVDLVADNGDRAYGTVQDFVFILTCDEYRKYRDYIPHYDRWIWTATPLGCGDKDSDAGESIVVRTVNDDGLLYNYGACNGGAVAPACILNPKYLNLRQSMAYVEEVSE
jgi:hypothetical protein